MAPAPAPRQWSAVQWTESRQIFEFLEWEDRITDALPQSVPEGYEHLLAHGEPHDAIYYLGTALPRMEALRWAADFLDELSRDDVLTMRDQQALDSVQRWIGDPGEEFRRGAFAAAENASSDAPERMLALAAFFSGGNISSPDLEPVEPPPNAAGKLAATAILGGIFRNGPDPARLERALNMGEERAR